MPETKAEKSESIHTVIVLPTYNERGNIEKLLDAIISQRAQLDGIKLSVLVVDDSSPDGTGEAVREFARRSDNSGVYLLSGQKKGLGTAYKRGILHALDILNADIVFQMDADFSHDPQDLPRFTSEVERCDFVVGSRYVAGGSVPENWSRLRKAISKWGNIFARHIAGLDGVRDCTSGYRAIRASVLREIDLEQMDATGYIFIMNLLYEAVQNGARVSEIPIKFTNRLHGESKLGAADIIGFIRRVFLIRLNSLKRRQRG
ncbi:MAG TPA: polyprenol monophosphomannose synthase [Pyrinomonadaceae bacterium]|nr:polyprenol monophosphomannose synthase [Pyrinomonadaceae bacterium]